MGIFIVKKFNMTLFWRWMLIIVVLMFMSIIGIWFWNKKEVCKWNVVNSSDHKNLQSVYCGYISINKDSSFWTYMGKLKKAYVKNDKVFLDVDLGSDTESVFLGNFKEGDYISLTLINNDYVNGNMTNSEPVTETILLNEGGIENLNNYTDKYVSWTSFVGSVKSNNFVNRNILNLTEEERQYLDKQYSQIYKCNWYEVEMKKYLLSKENVIDFWILKLNKLSGCHLFGSGFLVYE